MEKKKLGLFPVNHLKVNDVISISADWRRTQITEANPGFSETRHNPRTKATKQRRFPDLEETARVRSVLLKQLI